MTFFSRCDTASDFGGHAAAGRTSLRRERARRHRALAGFMEDIGILLRYATGRDYYDRRSIASKN